MTEMAPDVFAVVLAGGSGTRFWPKSRHLTPKQLCRIGGGDKTMIEATLDRLDGFVPPERRFIVTHHSQADATRRIVGSRAAAVIEEPEARNTAAALALAAAHIERHGGHPDPVMISNHADAVIRDEKAFLSAMADAVEVARQAKLALIGIVPTYAETGYGYIELGEKLPGGKGHEVESFREKPPRDLAEEYFRSGRFLWNAGIFVWKTRVLLEELEARLPATVSAMAHLDDPAALKSAYGEIPKISIDNGLLEVSRKVAVIPADIGWQDVGSWDALPRVFATDEAGNYLQGDVLQLDCAGSTIDTDGPFVATIGLEDMVVVCAKGAVLVCPTARAQEVKRVVEHLTREKRMDLI